jgi:hypothetical protein
LAESEFPDQGNESDIGDRAASHVITLALDERQHLGRAVSQRYDHAPFWRQLIHEWSRYFG